MRANAHEETLSAQIQIPEDTTRTCGFVLTKADPGREHVLSETQAAMVRVYSISTPKISDPGTGPSGASGYQEMRACGIADLSLISMGIKTGPLGPLQPLSPHAATRTTTTAEVAGIERCMARQIRQRGRPTQLIAEK